LSIPIFRLFTRCVKNAKEEGISVSMKNFIIKFKCFENLTPILVSLGLAFSSLGWAQQSRLAPGGDVSGGGDAYAIEFTRIRGELSERLVRARALMQEEPFAESGFTIVAFSGKPIAVSSTPDLIFIKGAEKDAESFTNPARTRISRKAWDRISPQRKSIDVQHEVCVALGLEENDDYNVSSTVFTIVDALLTKDPTAEQMRIQLGAQQMRIDELMEQLKKEAPQSLNPVKAPEKNTQAPVAKPATIIDPKAKSFVGRFQPEAPCDNSMDEFAEVDVSIRTDLNSPETEVLRFDSINSQLNPDHTDLIHLTEGLRLLPGSVPEGMTTEKWKTTIADNVLTSRFVVYMPKSEHKIVRTTTLALTPTGMRLEVTEQSRDREPTTTGCSLRRQR
jgi:hypothetical protein